MDHKATDKPFELLGNPVKSRLRGEKTPFVMLNGHKFALLRLFGKMLPIGQATKVISAPSALMLDTCLGPASSSECKMRAVSGVGTEIAGLYIMSAGQDRRKYECRSLSNHCLLLAFSLLLQLVRSRTKLLWKSQWSWKLTSQCRSTNTSDGRALGPVQPRLAIAPWAEVATC